MSLREKALQLHSQNHGKLATMAKVPVRTSEDLTLAYTPGVAEPCKEIHSSPEMVYDYTGQGNAVAVVTNGSAVLGLGDIGAKASLPVMEGKCVLFKSLAGIDAYPIALDSTDPKEIIRAVEIFSTGFGGINLEDIKAPDCFEIENALRASLDIPVFHDDQHGTAIVVLSGLLNAAKLVKKQLESCNVVINGAGAAGLAVAKLLLSVGVQNIKVCNRSSILFPGSPQCSFAAREEIARETNPEGQTGSLAEALRGADIFIGLSGPGVIDAEMVASMANNAIVMAMANPVPEILPEEAHRGGAGVVLTGRSDFPNQINNVSAFPGVFRGALDVRAREINEGMKIAAAHALATLVSEEELKHDYVVAEALDPRVVPTAAKAVARAAMETGAASVEVDPDEVYASAAAYALEDRGQRSKS